MPVDARLVQQQVGSRNHASDEDFLASHEKTTCRLCLPTEAAAKHKDQCSCIACPRYTAAVVQYALLGALKPYSLNPLPPAIIVLFGVGSGCPMTASVSSCKLSRSSILARRLGKRRCTLPTASLVPAMGTCLVRGDFVVCAASLSAGLSQTILCTMC